MIDPKSDEPIAEQFQRQALLDEASQALEQYIAAYNAHLAPTTVERYHDEWLEVQARVDKQIQEMDERRKSVQKKPTPHQGVAATTETRSKPESSCTKEANMKVQHPGDGAASPASCVSSAQPSQTPLSPSENASPQSSSKTAATTETKNDPGSACTKEISMEGHPGNGAAPPGSPMSSAQPVPSPPPSSEHASPQCASEISQTPPIQGSTEQVAIEQPVSQRQVDANRKNALRSTGPKTPRGKGIAARNAMKHGLLAKSAVMPRGPLKESQAEFDELLRGLYEYFAPLGMAEELLVQEIAVCYWMERRAQLYENASICKQAWPDRPAAPEYKPWKELGYTKGERDWIRELLDRDEGYRLLRYPEGVEYLLGLLAQLKESMTNKGMCTGDLLEPLAEICGGYWETINEKNEYKRPELLAEIDKEKQKLELLKKKLKEKPKSRRRILDFSHTGLLLATEELELVQRYTAAHEKRRYRALAQLERLQRQRSGETIPAPIDVQVTGVGDFAKRSQ